MDVLPEFFRTSQRKLDEGRNSPAINVFSELAVQAWRPKNKNENSVPAEMFIKTARNEQKTKNKYQNFECRVFCSFTITIFVLLEEQATRLVIKRLS